MYDFRQQPNGSVMVLYCGFNMGIYKDLLTAYKNKRVMKRVESRQYHRLIQLSLFFTREAFIPNLVPEVKERMLKMGRKYRKLAKDYALA